MNRAREPRLGFIGYAIGLNALKLMAIGTLLVSSGVRAEITRDWPQAEEPQLCGWDASELVNGVPASVASLARRSSNVPGQAVDKLVVWVSKCDDRAAEEAVAVLRRAHARHRNDHALTASLGISIARGPGIRVKGGVGVLYAAARAGSRPEKEAVTLLSEVGEAEDWPEVANELALLGLATRRVQTLEVAAGLLRRLNQQVNDPRTWSTLAEVELALGDTAAAASSSAAAIEQGDASARRTLGIARLRAGDPSGASVYLDALAAADERGLALYLDDLRPLLTFDEAAAFPRMSVPEKREWLRRAWDWRAAEATLSVPERLIEHFRRLYFAYEHYTRQSYLGAPPFNALWRNDYIGVPRLDDRGISYVRHGPPDEVARLVFPGSTEETWLYAGLAGGVAAIDFTKDPSIPDYYIPDPSGGRPRERPSRVRTGSEKLRGEALGLYYAAIGNFILTKAPCGHAWGCAPDRFKPIVGPDVRHKLGRAVFQSETARPRLTEPLNTLLNTYAFRGPADSTELAIIFSVHGQEIAPADSAETPAYRLRFFAAVQDSLTRRVVRSDSLVSITAPERFGADAVVRYTPTLVTPASTAATIRASVRNQVDTLQGQIVRMTRTIPSFALDSLAMSDLVIAEPRAGNWTRHGVGLEPIAGNRLVANQPFRLFYEVYGVPQDEIVDVDIKLAPDRPGGLLGRIADLISRREAMSLHFQEPVQLAGPDVAAVTRDITVELEAGEYTLSVKVTRRQDGASCSGSTTVVVHKPD